MEQEVGPSHQTSKPSIQNLLQTIPEEVHGTQESIDRLEGRIASVKESASWHLYRQGPH